MSFLSEEGQLTRQSRSVTLDFGSIAEGFDGNFDRWFWDLFIHELDGDGVGASNFREVGDLERNDKVKKKVKK